MFRATLKSLFAHKLRMGMSAFAIVLGVAFVAGTLIFTDTLSSSFSQLFAQTAPDVTVRPAQAAAAASGGFTGADSRTVPAAIVDELAALDGVARADGTVSDQGTYIIGKDGKVLGSGGGPRHRRELQRRAGREWFGHRLHRPGCAAERPRRGGDRREVSRHRRFPARRQHPAGHHR